MLSPSEIAERLPVWTTLSELFLDTELTERDIRRIADSLRHSPYRKAELDEILRDEVAPAFSGNLLSVAGEWAPWAEAEVEAIVGAWMVKRSATGLLAKLRCRFQLRIIPEEWQRIAALI